MWRALGEVDLHWGSRVAKGGVRMRRVIVSAMVGVLVAVEVYRAFGVGSPVGNAKKSEGTAGAIAPARQAPALPDATPAAAKQQTPYPGPGAGDDRSRWPDSFRYYGPNGLWKQWTKDQKIGRDTWFFYTGGTQHFYRILARFGGTVGLSVDFFRLLATSPEARFRALGLINEPNFAGKVEDDWGFVVDAWKGDPEPGAYPNSSDPAVARWMGAPVGIVGMRKFANPAFTQAMAAEWARDKKASVRRYFANPGRVEPPYLVGITCALCHVAFDPLNPPANPIQPRWENLAANIGNQYLREGDLFFGAGRVVGGDANPGPGWPADPYDTQGLDPKSFLYQYGHTQEPGTSETSRFSYDFINNPNTINQIFNLGGRALFSERTPHGGAILTNHVLKDGADSIGINAALLRVYINIGSEGDYWADHLWNPVAGTTQRPFSIAEVRMAGGLLEPGDDAQRARKAELLARYPELGQAWRETERRVPFLVSYLASYTPYSLASIKGPDGAPRYISRDPAVIDRGRKMYELECARCHSNKQPFYPMSTAADRARFFAGLAPSDQFLPGNTLSDDVRYPFNLAGFGVNAARALATNAIDGDIWAEFSSRNYKALPPLGYMKFVNPLNTLDPPIGAAPITTEFVAPGGGRGYYRTAALNSMWATAPFLHNNAVGRPPVDSSGLTDPAAITVEGRLALFEDAISELLSPQSRRPKIKTTSAASSLTAGLTGIEASLALLVGRAGKQAVEDALEDAAADVVKKLEPPAEARQAFGEAVHELKSRLKPEIDALGKVEDLVKAKLSLAAHLKEHIDALAEAKIKSYPQAAQLLDSLHAGYKAALEKRAANLGDAIASKFTIPKGFPVNLFLNLRVDKVPYAAVAYVKYKDDPDTLAVELLKLSECPDLVENRGHEYGSALAPADKRALIEYLKTL